MRTNVHVHLFSADHTPSTQLYYLLRGTLHDAGRALLPKVLGHQDVTTEDLERLDRSMDRFEWPWPMLFDAAVALTRIRMFGMVNPRRLIEMFTTISRIAPGDARAALRVDEEERETDLLNGIVARSARLRGQGVLFPFRDALCELVAELFEAHRRGVAQHGPRTQEELWNLFMSSPGSERYQQVIVLSIDFDQAFLDDDLPGLDPSPALDFETQMAELELLAQKQNAKGGVQIVPFLGLDPRGHDAAHMEAFVAQHAGKTKPWKGLKIYPPMGVFPADDRLRGVFDYCQDQGLPVLSHCSSGGAGVRGTNRNYADLAHPSKWDTVLSRLEKRFLEGKAKGTFRLCLAHFDSLEQRDDVSWCDEIMNTMERFDGKKGVEVYSDVAFDLIGGEAPRSRYGLNVARVQKRGLSNRVLFGSDWWNYLFGCASEKEFVDQLEVDEGWWKSTEFEAAARSFLADVVVQPPERAAAPRRPRRKRAPVSTRRHPHA